MVQFPFKAEDLVAELDKMFPEKVAEAGDEMVSIQRYAAKRELIIFLKGWRDQRSRSAARKAKR